MTFSTMRRAAASAARFLLLALLLPLLAAEAAHAEILLRDATGRDVRLAKPAERIVTNESLLILELALIEPDPVSKIAGWAAPRRLDAGVFMSFRQRFPAIDAIPEVGGVVAKNTSVESLLSAKPDLFVVSLWGPGWQEIADGLQAAGVPTIFLDAPERTSRNPAEAIAFSLRLLGEATGRTAEADAYSAFMLDRYREVRERLAGADARPAVLMDAFAGTECCSVPGSANRLTEYLTLAGGKSLGADVIPGYDGRLGTEAVIGADPPVYIGTGGPHLAGHGLVLGGGISAADARASLQAVLSQGIRSQLTAVREKRAHGISHQLAISALSIVAFECFAKWIHPELFADLDARRTLAEINTRFLAVPLTGTFWVDMEDAAP